MYGWCCNVYGVECCNVYGMGCNVYGSVVMCTCGDIMCMGRG